MREVNENPFILTDIDCNQISKWQNIVQKQASQEILKKISELPSSFSNSFELQTLNGAGGALVNLDYFSTNVTKFPNNSKTGKAYTPDEFLDYIRRNINNFNVGSKFNPYCNITSMCAKETSLWNSSNPKGAILYIDILGDDGVVITTDFSNDGWYFMTMNAPYAGNHPVSGTRQFGYEKQANGSYDFFVRGADRIDSRSIENILRFATADNPFFGADKLWQSFQEKVKAFTNGNGGISTVKQPIKNRPNWENVKDVLQGKKPISVLGCK